LYKPKKARIVYNLFDKTGEKYILGNSLKIKTVDYGRVATLDFSGIAGATSVSISRLKGISY
jgi:hypothetical protein